MDLQRFKKYIHQWDKTLSPKFDYRYVVIGLERGYAKDWYNVVFCENMIDVYAVEYGMRTQDIKYISHYKISDLDTFPRNTRGLKVVGLPFYSHIYWGIGLQEHLAHTDVYKQAKAHEKNVMAKLRKA